MSYLKTVFDNPHTKVHAGKLFLVSKIFTSVADNGNAEVLIVTGAVDQHTAVLISASGDIYTYLYEDTTTSNDGTPLSVVNANREGTPATAVGSAYFAPTITADGTKLTESFTPGGSNPFATGGSDGNLARGPEVILETNKKYLFRATNKSGAAATISIQVGYYEH